MGRGDDAEPGAAARAHAARARRALADGDHLDALDALEEALRLSGPAARGVALRLWGADHVEAAAGAGDGDRAAERLRALMACAAEDDEPALDALVHRAAGIVARDADMDLLFQEALALHAELPERLEHGRTLLAYGDRLRRAGRADEAAAHLTAALGVLRGLGADGWERRCRAALAACTPP